MNKVDFWLLNGLFDEQVSARLFVVDLCEFGVLLIVWFQFKLQYAAFSMGRKRLGFIHPQTNIFRFSEQTYICFSILSMSSKLGVILLILKEYKV